MINFDKKINDYRSQVLWRVKDCEELLKGRVANQELVDSIRSLELRMLDKIDVENKTLHGRLMKTIETCQSRIKTAEAFSSDKYMESASLIKQVDERVAKMATIDMIDQVYDSQKHLKNNFNNEFASFQSYLKDQNNKNIKYDLRQREIERQLKVFEQFGGVEELSKFIKEIQDERAAFGLH